MTDPALLARTAERLRNVAGFFAFELDRYRQVVRIDPAEDFGLSASSLTQLALCRVPRREHFADDVSAIATRVGTSETSVANLLRTVEALTSLARRGRDEPRAGSGTAGLLAAARDQTEEHTGFEDPGGGDTLPGWLDQGIDRFWDEVAAPETFPRDLYLPILINLPIAIIEIEDLTVDSLDRWLQQHQLPTLVESADRPLRGCLAAYRGVGVLFVDESDEPSQRRLTVAHEVAHFVVDYLLPREDVARRRPDLMAVLDGDRAATNAERFDALLADVPIGFHTHLLERDLRGGHLSIATAQVEDRAERLALELLAPLRSVLQETANDKDPETVLVEHFGLPKGAAARYANYIRRMRPGRPSSLLDAIGLIEPSDVQKRLGTVNDQNSE